ncbi:protein of unknown function [Azospirillum lipoferum 4B]|uniref:Uncharacterized protein n=1 Tax=Azospirillum lipoferum (strain 4B) TaxID=862719 RepID=G7Z7F5_AZOL4|nr:protein of unknown function [Azospirillum lipoferum 4B]
MRGPRRCTGSPVPVHYIKIYRLRPKWRAAERQRPPSDIALQHRVAARA